MRVHRTQRLFASPWGYKRLCASTDTIRATNRTIADDLRRRIATESLKAGDALPSIRALSRRWKVAAGTASHAIQVLVREGLVRSVPRSGYRVVGAIAAPERELSRQRIVQAGIRMADHHGLDGLSIRALAEVLGARPMSLYRHVENKDQLVWLMVDAALGEVALPEVATLGWREGLAVATRQEWRAMRNHPWLSRALLISRPGAQPNALAFADRVMAALEGTRLRAEEKLTLHVLLHSFVQGMAVNVEAEAAAERESGFDEAAYMRNQEAAFGAEATAPFPHFARVLAELAPNFEVQLDRLFEEGLAALLDGFGLRPALRSTRGRS